LTEQCGTPLLADSLYGPTPRSPLRAIGERLGRQALHAARLGFEHPITAERLSFEAPLPGDLQTALGELRALTGHQSTAQ
jgi:23S rRNA pseudouridine1911/1915/1917 synthase